MRNRVLSYPIFLVAFFIFVSIWRGWFDLEFVPFWIGGLIGVFLPDVDQLVNAYFLKPNASDSRKTVSMIKEGKVGNVYMDMLNKRVSNKDLVFHNVLFQIVFSIFAFFVVSSGGSLLGSGIVLGFMLHLVVDQLTDKFELGNIADWFSTVRVNLSSRDQSFYLFFNVVVLFVFGFLF